MGIRKVKQMYDFTGQLVHTSSTRDCMVNQTATEPSHIDEMAKVFGTYAGRTNIAIEEARKTKYTDAKQTMLMEQIALGLAWIADELAALRRGDKDGKP